MSSSPDLPRWEIRAEYIFPILIQHLFPFRTDPKKSPGKALSQVLSHSERFKNKISKNVLLKEIRHGLINLTKFIESNMVTKTSYYI